MDDSFDGDSFGDDFNDDEVIAEIDSRKQINRHVRTIEVSLPRQSTLDGQFVSHLDENGKEVTFRQIQNIVSFGPTHHELNYDNLQTYIYPTNFEVRDYQFDIVLKSLFKNILCALPTGLGKTFIASTVILNFYRWTVSAKIVFMAPTRPLVAQQTRACYEITGIPSHDTAILLDKTKKNRAEIWESKRVFFTTPQVIENDLKSGFVNPKDIVCMVIDEAHRAKGNYAYNNVMKFMKRFTSSFRVLALTATPASEIDGVQELINNLSISKVEIRTETSLDTAKYMKKKIIDRITCPPNNDMLGIVELLVTAAQPTLEKCLEFKIYDIVDPYKINAFAAMEASQRVIKNPSISEGLKWMYYFLLQILAVVGQGLRRIHIYGIRSFYSYFKEKHVEFAAKWETKKSTNKYAADFYYHPNIQRLLGICEKVIETDDRLSAVGQGTSGLFSHTKFEYMVNGISEFFSTTEKPDSRAIIFTEFRESALEIVRVIDTYNTNNRTKLSKELKPHIFIGQAREKEKFDDVAFRKKAAPKKKGRKNSKEIEEENERKRREGEESKRKKMTISSKRAGSRVGSSEAAQEQGMNQQQQKDLINKFKKGDFNIIVATSIGEEGLDIGEVDLIICFDSTSSPIKNIQRMGRTGRKRDGKVILLFSSNEESKFDKAMGGYEYIQKQIQAGQNIKYELSDRIVPKHINPTVEKKFIEIPEENDKLIQLADDDSDEFLKLATQATLVSKNKNAKSKRTQDHAKQKKLEKRFFMPDNVETGFKRASSLVTKNSNAEAPPTSIHSSGDDDDDLFHKKRNDISVNDVTYTSVSDLKNKSFGNSSTQSIIIDDDEEDELDALMVKKDQEKDSLDFLEALNTPLAASQESDHVEANPAAPSSLLSLVPPEDNLKKPVKSSKKPVIGKKAVQNTKKSKVLGASRRISVNVLESLKRQAKERPLEPIIVNKSDIPILVEDASQPDNASFQARALSVVEQMALMRKDFVVDPSQFSVTDGYLTPAELDDFHKRYRACEVQIDETFFIPNAAHSICCSVGHSTKSHRFLDFMDFDDN